MTTVMRLLGGKYKIGLLWMISSHGSLRYNDLKRIFEDEISSRMLSISLHELESDGLIARTEISRRPLHVEYSLTSVGASLIPVLEELATWGAAYQDMMCSKGE